MHEVLVNRLGGLSLPRKSVVRLTDRPDMTLDVYRGRKTTMQQCNNVSMIVPFCAVFFSHEMSWMRPLTYLSQFRRVFLPTLDVSCESSV